MKIVNNTHYDTRSIMKLVYRVAQDELNPGGLDNGRITINYRRNGGLGGWCYYGTIQNPNVRMRLNLPRTNVDPVALALVIAHELGHAKGLKHRDMNAVRYNWGEGWRERYAYAKDYPIGVKAAKPEPTKDEKLTARRAARLTKAQKMVEKWESKVKRANTTLKKWRVKLKAAERINAPRLSSVGQSAAVETPCTEP
jgi:hypothetical protein